jgi:hypothetical protein
MKARLLICALSLAIVGPATAQIVSGSGNPSPGSWNKPKPVNECKLGHAAAATQLENDLAYVRNRYKNDPAELKYQQDQIIKQMQTLARKRVVCGCVKGALPELPPANPGAGGGGDVPPSTKRYLEGVAGKSLTKAQLDSYLSQKRNAATLLTAKQLEYLERKFNQKVDPAMPNALSDEQFVECIRMSREEYYTVGGRNVPTTDRTLVVTGGFDRGGAKQAVPGLQLVRVQMKGQQLPPLRPGQPQLPQTSSNKEKVEFVQPTAKFGVELWPTLFGSADEVFSRRK